jgi:protein-S-isoprenylcysteine O-methyltransferase Ste14
MHEPLVCSSPKAVLFWAVYIWAFAPEFRIISRSAKSPDKSQDAGTARLIIIGNWLATFAGFGVSFMLQFSIPHPHIVFNVCVCLLLAGSILRRFCFRALGKYFTGVITVEANQPIIDCGPYRWVRHPSYTGGIIMFLGIGVALGNWLSMIILFLIPCYIYSRRVKAEEKAMLSTIGAVSHLHSTDQAVYSIHYIGIEMESCLLPTTF